MRRLADEKLQITLALSLHGSTQEKRQELMPVAKKYAMDEVLDACRYYFDQTGRRITFEYSLVGGVNDTEADAEETETAKAGEETWAEKRAAKKKLKADKKQDALKRKNRGAGGSGKTPDGGI